MSFICVVRQAGLEPATNGVRPSALPIETYYPKDSCTSANATRLLFSRHQSELPF